MAGAMDILLVGGLVVGGYVLWQGGFLSNLIPSAQASGSGTGEYGGGGRPPKTKYNTHTQQYSGGGGSYGGGDPGWYTSGPNGSGHHHCKKGQPDCACSDPGKCVSAGVPPGPGQCKPEWGTKQALGGGPYPDQSQLPQEIAKCPPGTH